LKQTLETPYDPGPLLLDGPNVRVTSAEQLLTRVPGCAPADTFSVELSRGVRTLELTFGKGQGASLDVLSMRYSEGKQEGFLVTQAMTDAEIRPLLPKPLRDFPRSLEEGGRHKGFWVVERNRCFLAFAPKGGGQLRRELAGELRISPSDLFAPIIEGAIHLPGLRGNPERTYKRTAVGPKFPGTFDDYAASVIYDWEAHGEPPARLGGILEELGLTWKVKAKPVNDSHVELRVGRLVHARQGGARDLVNIADVGFGVSQSLPVIVALLVARPDQLVYLEQPEIHLHPRVQRQMARILANAAKRGVIVVAETHSALIVREIQTLVANGDLESKYVKLHWFTRNATDGTTEVRSADLDQNGAYGSWPEDFDDVALASEKDYLDAVERPGGSQ
ncbi:MAG TPA: AAA family ATPase, partial [Phycisphaerae bacterium]|nr:AAA family ATPase [Phycisphaerae bacterium]